MSSRNRNQWKQQNKNKNTKESSSSQKIFLLSKEIFTLLSVFFSLVSIFSIKSDISKFAKTNRCCVLKCEKASLESQTKRPKHTDNDEKAKWTRAIRHPKKDSWPSLNSVGCSRHFPSLCFIKESTDELIPCLYVLHSRL